MKNKEKLTLKQVFYSSIILIIVICTSFGIGCKIGYQGCKNSYKHNEDKLINDAYVIGYDHGYNNQTKWKKDSLKTYLMPQEK